MIGQTSRGNVKGINVTFCSIVEILPDRNKGDKDLQGVINYKLNT